MTFQDGKLDKTSGHTTTVFAGQNLTLVVPTLSLLWPAAQGDLLLSYRSYRWGAKLSGIARFAPVLQWQNIGS